jgi:hypothetical protein
MGCASSKPSSNSKSKNKDSTNTNGSSSNNNKQKTNTKKTQNTNNTNSSFDKLEKIKNEQIRIDNNLIDQIELYQNKVIDYIVKVVRKELNSELVKNSAGSNNFVAVIQAATAAQDNDDLITDVASKAIFLIKTGRCNTTYRNLNDSLKSSNFLCKNQTHKTRICELTTETIYSCLSALNTNSNNLIDLLDDFESNKTVLVDNNNNRQDVINLNNKTINQENQWDNAILLSRSEANEVARMLFYSNRARPVIHASPKAKDAYFVNKQLNENLEVTVDRNEIDEILHTFNQPVLNNIQNQYQYFNDNTNQNENNLTPVVSNESETPSSNKRLSSNFEGNNLSERFNQTELDNSFDVKEQNDEQLSNKYNDVEQIEEINPNSLLASIAAISALTTNLNVGQNDQENLNGDLVLNDNSIKLGNNDSDNFSNDKNIEYRHVDNFKDDFSSKKDKYLEEHSEDTTTTLNTEINNENNISILNNTNYEDANTTLNSLNLTNNSENQANNSG